jgi:mono/diheme cytochrome c family protein
MKKLLKILGLVFAILILLVVFGALYINLSGIPKYDPPPNFSYDIPMDSATIAEGARISAVVCGECHRGEDKKLSGKRVADLPEFFGTAYSSNITQHPEYGIGDWTPSEIAYFLRTGIKRDGSYAPPWMPKLATMSDRDMKAVIAFLLSDHPKVQPSTIQQPPCKPSFMVKALSRVAFKPLPYPEKTIPYPDETDPLIYGEYLATGKYGCYECHSADFKTNNQLDPEASAGYFGGGNPMLNYEKEVIITPNITMHDETGIGSWTYDEFYNTVKWGKTADGGSLRYPMPIYTVLHDSEIEAIWKYLQAVPEIDNAVVDNAGN